MVEGEQKRFAGIVLIAEKVLGGVVDIGRAGLAGLVLVRGLVKIVSSPVRLVPRVSIAQLIRTQCPNNCI